MSTMHPGPIDVFADITCPFTHVGLHLVADALAARPEPVDVIVRAWPLEWVNGQPLDAEAVAVKGAALANQLGMSLFTGLRTDRWPATTIPALDLVAEAYAIDAATGLAASLRVRTALFEEGRDIADPTELRVLAAELGVPTPSTDDARPDRVSADYEEGRRRGVRGSPHFWAGDHEFFCPSLDLGHDADGLLVARFDTDGLAGLLAAVG